MCVVAHLVSPLHTCSSQHSPPTAWMKPLKTGMGRQQCVDWLGPRGYSSWKAVLHQAPLCLLGTYALWCVLNQHVAHVESIPVSTPNLLCDSVVGKVTGLSFCLCYVSTQCSENGSKYSHSCPCGTASSLR